MSNLASIVARRRLGGLTGLELVEWAVAGLAAGLDSGGLRRLAGLDLEGEPRLAEAESLFVLALDELA